MNKYRPFSARQGLLGSSVLQIDGMTERLRNRLYGVLKRHGFSTSLDWGSGLSEKGHALADGFFGLHADAYAIFGGDRLQQVVVQHFKAAAWNEVYDLLEFTVAHQHVRMGAVRDYNVVLEEESAGYRFVGTRIVPVTDGTELTAIEEALVDPVAAARDHIAKSLALLAVRPHPNYAKVAGEAIQAVEAAVRELVGAPAATLGDALKTFRRNGAPHPALVEAWLKLHGWASDEGGVRHAFKGEPVDEDLARYVLVSCSAFVGYLTGVKSKQSAP